jgi:hypothetical protein
MRSSIKDKPQGRATGFMQRRGRKLEIIQKQRDSSD